MKKLKKWLAYYIFKKEIESIHNCLRQLIAEQQEEINNLKERLYQLTKGQKI